MLEYLSIVIIVVICLNWYAKWARFAGTWNLTGFDFQTAKKLAEEEFYCYGHPRSRHEFRVFASDLAMNHSDWRIRHMAVMLLRRQGAQSILGSQSGPAFFSGLSDNSLQVAEACARVIYDVIDYEIQTITPNRRDYLLREIDEAISNTEHSPVKLMMVEVQEKLESV